ncbi:MAG TPA: hypothetical protein VLA43_15635, partial [Longimicrobiales bacterium]|nr:hypothetical protein [Longimicrobiales bacterium]
MTAAAGLLVAGSPGAGVAQDVPPLTRLHLFPGTEFLPPWTASIEFGQTTTFGGGTADGGPGSGNQTYHGWLEIGLPGPVALLGILEQNDDPTWSRLGGTRYAKEIFAIGGGARALLGTWRGVRVAAEATLASLQLKSDPGLFNPEPGLTRTGHLSGSASLALGIPLSPAWTVTAAPGVVILPDSVTGLPFFGWSGVLGVGVDGELAPGWRAFAAGEVLLGPGTNSVDARFRYRRVPAGSAGLVHQASSRVQVTGYLTNLAGGTPATRLLTQLGAVPLQWGARVRYAPWEPERERGPSRDDAGGPGASPDPAATEGGIALAPAGTLPTLAAELRATTQEDRSLSARLRMGLSSELEVELALVRVPGLDAEPALGIRLGDGLHYRMGGKLQLLAERWGHPITVGARVAVGRDGDTGQGYLVAELPVRRMLAPWAAVTVAPMLLQTGGESPVFLGVAAVLGRREGVQVVLEPTVRLTDLPGTEGRFPWAAAVRSPAWNGLRAEAFATTTLGLAGVGRFLAD